VRAFVNKGRLKEMNKKALIVGLGVTGVTLVIFMAGLVIARRTGGPAHRVQTPTSLSTWLFRSAMAEPVWYGEEDKDMQTFHNGYIITHQIGWYINDRRAFPATYADLTASPYGCIRSQDLTNPYTGAPVAEDPAGSLGNITWSLPDPGHLRIRIPFIHRLDGQEHAYETEDNLERYQEGDFGILSEDSSDPNYIWTGSCFFLAKKFLMDYHHDFGTFPETFSEILNGIPILQKMWNRYQNRYVNFQAQPNPVPGDIYYRSCVVGSERQIDLVAWLPEGQDYGYSRWECSGYPG